MKKYILNILIALYVQCMTIGSVYGDVTLPHQFDLDGQKTFNRNLIKVVDIPNLTLKAVYIKTATVGERADRYRNDWLWKPDQNLLAFIKKDWGPKSLWLQSYCLGNSVPPNQCKEGIMLTKDTQYVPVAIVLPGDVQETVRSLTMVDSQPSKPIIPAQEQRRTAPPTIPVKKIPKKQVSVPGVSTTSIDFGQ
jgi:hypothetical protein